MTSSLIQLFERDFNRLNTEIETVSNEHLWSKIDGISNTIGNLTLHICGNTQHFIGATLGKSGYIRQREKEFGDKNLSKDLLFQQIELSKGIVTSTLNKLSPKDLLANYPIEVFGEPITTDFFLIHLESHLNYHLGQINYLRRILSNH